MYMRRHACIISLHTRRVITNSDHAIVAQMTNSHEQYLTAIQRHENQSTSKLEIKSWQCIFE